MFDSRSKGTPVLENLQASSLHQPSLPIDQPTFGEQIQLRNENHALLANIVYELKLQDETVHTGVTDAKGKTERITTTT